MLSDAKSEGEFFRFGSSHLLSDLITYTRVVHDNVKSKIIFVGEHYEDLIAFCTECNQSSMIFISSSKDVEKEDLYFLLTMLGYISKNSDHGLS